MKDLEGHLTKTDQKTIFDVTGSDFGYFWEESWLIFLTKTDLSYCAIFGSAINGVWIKFVILYYICDVYNFKFVYNVYVQCTQYIKYAERKKKPLFFLSACIF